MMALADLTWIQRSRTRIPCKGGPQEELGVQVEMELVETEQAKLGNHYQSCNS